MDPKKISIKNLCIVFNLTGIEWLPSSVENLFYYLLNHPTAFLDGDILFLNIKNEIIEVQLLTIIASKGEIIVEKPAVFYWDNDYSLSPFIKDQLIHYGGDLGVFKDGLWNIDKILLITDNAEKDINKNFFGNTVQVLSPDKSLHNSTDSYDGQVFNSILIIYSKYFYIERKINTDSLSTALEPLPFPTEIALNINQRYKIFSFSAGSEYNIAENKKFLQVKLFEKDLLQGKTADEQPRLILDLTEEMNNNQAVINIYLNLPLTCLELECTDDLTGLSSADDLLQELQNRQLSGYDFIKDSQLINPQLLYDFGSHLQDRDNTPPSAQFTGKTIYYRALTLLNLLSGKK